MVRFHQLDTLRYCFAALVAACHVIGFDKAVTGGGYAVDFFFILSGFVLQHSLVARMQGWGRFFIARVARLWPLHVLTLILTIVGIVLLRKNGHVLPPVETLLRHALLLQVFVPRDVIALNFPSWSISAELVVNATVFFWLARRQAYWLAFVAACVLYGYIAYRFGGFDHFHRQPFLFATGGLYRCAAGILLGVASYGAWMTLQKRVSGLTGRAVAMIFTGAELAIVGVVIALFNRPLESDGLVLVAAMAVAVITLACAKGWVSALLSVRPVAYFGSLSYGVYLLHIPMFYFLGALGLLPEQAGWGWAAGFLVLVTLVAIPIHHGFELPAKGWIMRRQPFGR